MIKLIHYLFSALAIFGCTFTKHLHKDNKPNDSQGFVIIGCSAAGSTALAELAQLTPEASIVCISNETAAPYKKPSIHSVVSGKKNFSQIQLLKTDDSRIPNDLVWLNTTVAAIDRQAQVVTTNSGKRIPYSKLLIATGRVPYVPKELIDARALDGVHVYNSQSDVTKILSSLEPVPEPSIAIVGAGIRALELGDGLSKRFDGVTIHMINRSDRFLGDQGIGETDRRIKNALVANGVRVIAPATVQSVDRKQNGKLVVSLQKTDEQLEVDAVVFAIGTTPNSELAQKANLLLHEDGSIKVDDFMQTSDANIFAAGDVTGFVDHATNGVTHTPKWRSAALQAKVAAQNMTGKRERYKFIPPVFGTKFFGLKIVTGGHPRQKDKLQQLTHTSPNFYAYFAMDNKKLKAFTLTWPEHMKKPDLSFLLKAFTNQMDITPDILLQQLTAER